MVPPEICLVERDCFLHIFGNSLAIVNWFKGMPKLGTPALDHWCHYTTDFIPLFGDLQIDHIHIEHNIEVGMRFKHALDCGECSLVF